MVPSQENWYFVHSFTYSFSNVYTGQKSLCKSDAFPRHVGSPNGTQAVSLAAHTLLSQLSDHLIPPQLLPHIP